VKVDEERLPSGFWVRQPRSCRGRLRNRLFAEKNSCAELDVDSSCSSDFCISISDMATTSLTQMPWSCEAKVICDGHDFAEALQAFPVVVSELVMQTGTKCDRGVHSLQSKFFHSFRSDCSFLRRFGDFPTA
jgi:hypothetical protein